MESDYTVLLNWDNGTRPFKLRGGPIDNPDNAQQLFRLLGLAGASWGRLENHIDAILLQINQPYDSNKKLDLHDPYFPQRFTDKIKMLKKYFRKHPALQKHSASMVALVADLKQFSVFRNDFLHGIVEAYDPAKCSFIINSLQVNPSTGIMTVQRIERELAGLEDFIVKVNQANEWLITMSAQLFTPEGRAQLQRL